MLDTAHLFDEFLRLFAAVAIGVALGLDRNLNGKPTGMRTLGLVSFATALVTLAGLEYQGIRDSIDAESRVNHAVIQGALVGIGFLGGGIILRDVASRNVLNLTTAASVWTTAVMGIACALAPWPLIGVGVFVLFTLVVGCRWLEEHFGLKDKENET
jgi:putative Mg2+ transporter-C (MgtC) family protein